VFGFVHMSMIATTKHMVNFAAFSASRTAFVNGNTRFGASGALLYLNWRGTFAAYIPGLGPQSPFGPSRTNMNVRGRSRDGFRVEYRVPFGLPVLNNIPMGGLAIRSFSPYGGDRNKQVQERGDNR